ncbi:MAG: hypothetical protein AAF726_12530 [Planctomycetota bacterium]
MLIYQIRPLGPRRTALRESVTGSIGVLLALALLLVSCGGGRTVSARAFQYAAVPTETIVSELSAKNALSVLKELGRLEEQEGADGEMTIAEGPPGSASGSTDTEAFDLLLEGVTALSVTGTTVDVQAADPQNPVQLRRVRTPKEDALFKAGPYFSTLTAIAVEEGLDPTAIPGVAVGYRPHWQELGDWANFLSSCGLGFDFFVGGAVGPSGGDNGNVELALGAGITIPWSNNGAVSFGAVTWRTEEGDPVSANTEVAAYFSINLGNFNVSGAAR